MNIQTYAKSIISVLDDDFVFVLLSIKSRYNKSGHPEKWEAFSYHSSRNLINALYSHMDQDEETIFNQRTTMEWENYFASNQIPISELIKVLSYLSCQSFDKLYSDFLNCKAKAHTVPRDVLHVLLSSVVKPAGTIYFPSDSGCDLLHKSLDFLKANNMAVYSQQSSFSKLREAEALLHNKEINYTLAKIPADPLTKDCFDSKTFDCIISNPPFNFPNWHINEYLAYDPRWIYGIPPKTNANFAWLQHILYHLNGNGAAAVILPNSTLTSTNNQEYSIRRNIIESKVIEAIVTFPKGLFKTTQTAFCIWFIDKQIHYGAKDDVRRLVKKLFEMRKSEICKVIGKEISLEELYAIYKV